MPVPNVTISRHGAFPLLIYGFGRGVQTARAQSFRRSASNSRTEDRMLFGKGVQHCASRYSAVVLIIQIHERAGQRTIAISLSAGREAFLENLLPNCKVLNINTPKKQKVPKETNWKQKFQKPQNENICLTYLNTEMNGNFHFLSFCAAFLKVQNQVL